MNGGNRNFAFVVRRMVVVTLAVAACGCAKDQRPRLGEPAPVRLDTIETPDVQPLVAAALRLDEALDYLGSALAEDDSTRLRELAQLPHTAELAEEVQRILDPYCLAVIEISPEARVKVARGPAMPTLMQDGWKNFLIKVHNEAGLRSELRWHSANAEPVVHGSRGGPEPVDWTALSPGDLAHRFLEMDIFGGRPLSRDLSGAEVEYKIIQIYTRETGLREAEIGFHAGHGTQDIGFRNTVPILFECLPTVKLTLRVKDFDGSPTMASFVIRDNVDRGLRDRPVEEGPERELRRGDYRLNRAESTPWLQPGLLTKELVGVYPLPSRRVAAVDEFKDFFFQPQVYRADGEHVFLPPGAYDVTFTRGPEYVPQTRTIEIPDGVTEHEESFQLMRWIHMADLGWYSADHHVHAGGCAHYESPEAGVSPEAMFRQSQGEDLNLASVLSWGPCWYHQKTFFEGAVHALSTARHQIRYDVEVSGFPSEHAGHLCLLRLREDDYPGTTRIEEWPSWTLPILQWGQSQGGVVGYSHSGWGLEPLEETFDLPNYVMAKFDGIGANEYIVTVTHDAVDFISAGDTPVTWELNIWYHTLNCGFRTAISGETDFPCIYDDRIGMARSYAKLPGRLDFDGFMEQVRRGANYVSDGRSHIIDFQANNVGMGADGGELKLDGPDTVRIAAKVAAYLPEIQTDAGALIAGRPLDWGPYWHIERSRIGDSRYVPVELVVNGVPIAQQEIFADGTLCDVEFEVPIEKSSWAALRIFASAHTNPIYILVDDQPVRASRESAEWCRAAVDRCWEMKEPGIREEELPAAREAYEHARLVYDQILLESGPAGVSTD